MRKILLLAVAALMAVTSIEAQRRSCVADYFRDQSAGRLNLAFDIYGPAFSTVDEWDLNRWTEDNWLRSSYLSTSPYPYTDPETLAVNNSLTDESSPAATLFTAAADGREFMGKSITNIQLAADGTISFDFMKGTATSVLSWQEQGHNTAAPIYDLQGRRLSAPAKGIYLQGRKLIIKK